MITQIPLSSLRDILRAKFAPQRQNRPSVVKLMSEKELTQLSTLVSDQLELQLRSYRPDSPELIGHVLSIAAELAGLIEEAFCEASCLDEIEVEAERNRRRLAVRYCSAGI